MVTSADFQKVLNKIFKEASSNGKKEIEVISGNVHRIAGDYPGSNHRMPMCCAAMRKNMKSGDKIVRQPPKGNGASLAILYKLPRSGNNGGISIDKNEYSDSDIDLL